MSRLPESYNRSMKFTAKAANGQEVTADSEEELKKKLRKIEEFEEDDGA